MEALFEEYLEFLKHQTFLIFPIFLIGLTIIYILFFLLDDKLFLCYVAKVALIFVIIIFDRI